jgi:U3 small nucleolar RNA-associated protein 4
MDIHRCRFIRYPASAINAVAFTHAALPSVSLQKKHLVKHIQVRLAIGRANGDIEIWNPLQGAWHQELVIPGGKDRSVDGLVWVTEPDEEMADGKTIHGKSRLFSIGYTTTITEWDLEKAKAKKHASGQHGEIWCLGVQPPPNKGAATAASRKLVAGTVDGNLVLYSIEDGDLKFQRTLFRTPSKTTKFVSIAFQSHNVVVVGCSNSTICAYDIRNGTLLRQMTLGTDTSGGSKNIIVWSVKCLPNGDIVSGDSTGQVCIWDGKTYTQAQRIQSHSQDVLCLSVSADGSKIVSGGMDRRTAIYEPIAGQTGRWSKVFHRRYHQHDVKAMASFESKGMSVVVSGGMSLPNPPAACKANIMKARMQPRWSCPCALRAKRIIERCPIFHRAPPCTALPKHDSSSVGGKTKSESGTCSAQPSNCSMTPKPLSACVRTESFSPRS